MLISSRGNDAVLRTISIIHPEPQACDAFRNRFAPLPNVRVIQARYPDFDPHDCFVTAGNAFGIMTAGIDAAVVHFLGHSIMQQVQHRIMDEFRGEQPVGTAFILPTGNTRQPFLCHAPTMRVPGSIEGTDKIYSATWGALLAIQNHNVTNETKIQTVAFPAMGTGFGQVTYDEAARQMAVAYDYYLHPPHRLDWDQVVERHKAISYDGNRRVIR
jgi:O-acetyl-ADP-ribose deacetylase (regulator of RNase III)